MNFLFPAVLWGLALTAVPVIIHFFNFQRAKKVYFTNVAFLQSVTEYTNKRNRLRDLLVMLARIVFVAAIVLAFARPFLPAPRQQTTGASNYVSIYLDNSLSMQNEQQGSRLFDLAKMRTEEITELFPSFALYQLHTNNFGYNSSQFVQAGTLAEQLTETELAATSRSFGQVLERQHQSLQEADFAGGHHVFWLSDFQRNTFGPLADFAPDSSLRYYLLPLLPDAPANVAIDSVWLDAPFLQPEENNKLHVRLRNYGKQLVTNVALNLHIGGRQVGGTTATVPAEGRQEITLSFNVPQAGSYPCRLLLEDYPLVFDNEYYFVLNAAPTVNVAIVQQKPQSYLPTLFRGESFFKTKVYPLSNIDYGALTTTDLLVLENLNEIDVSLQAAARQVLSRGGSVVLLPGAEAAAADYKLLSGLGVQKVPDAQKLSLAPPDAKEPFFAGVFEKLSGRLNMPEAQAVLQWPRNRSRSLLRFTNGQPFLSRSNSGQGSLYLFASPLLTEYANLMRHALLVPLMYKIGIQSKQFSGQLAYRFDDELATIELDSARRTTVYSLTAEGVNYIPEQRQVGNKLLLNLPASRLEAGNYEVRDNETQQLVGHLALNYPSAESATAHYSTAELTEAFAAFPNVTLLSADDSNAFAAEFRKNTQAQQLWRWFVVLALVALLAETLLIRFWKTDKPQQEPVAV